MRTNASDIKAICKAICNTCYPDNDVIEAMLSSKGLVPEEETDGEFTPELVSVAIEIVRGWVETSRSEGGISVSASAKAINQNILYWCSKYGLDSDEFLVGCGTTIENGSNLW